MTIYRGPGGTGSATSDSDTTEFQEFVVDARAARDAALAAQTAAELAETNAETAETNAETAETNAETAATNAASSASSAASSASSASSSASAASTSASNASSSASSASTSATAASSSASAASTSASNAATSATNAASSATAAASSATSASSSASTATTQATNAAASASAASTSASSASAAQTAAEAARDAALSAYDNFDDRYLGPKASDPTLDNDGNALLTGALYFNTSSNVMKVYTGSSWVAAYVSAAGVLLTANNLSDVANTATARANLNVPTRTGGDASGTWGINISGNAATATSATSATSATTATTATNVSGGTASVTSITDSGNLTFTGTAQRITGDFSNGTVANRVMFQTSTTNGSTSLNTIPNGTSANSGINHFNNADPTNAGFVGFLVGSTEAQVRTGITGTGTYLPMTFYTGGSERMRLDTSGNVGIGTSTIGSAGVTLTSAYNIGWGQSAGESVPNIFRQASSAATVLANGYRYTDTANGFASSFSSSFAKSAISLNGGTVRFYTDTAATTSAGTDVTPTERARIDSSGNLLVGLTSGGKFSVSYGGNDTHFGLGANYDNYITAGSSGVTIFRNATTERARISSGGDLLVGTTGGLPGTNTARANFYSASNTLYAATSDASFTSDVVRFGCMRTSSSGYNLLNCYSGNGSTDVMSVVRMYVRGDGGIGNYQANNVNLSDRREKTDFSPAGSYLEKICAIPVQIYRYIDQEESDTDLTLGVVAQDVQEVAPELVTESNWGTEEEPKMRLSIYQTDLQYALMKCIQEQQAIIEQLKADVAALKGA